MKSISTKFRRLIVASVIALGMVGGLGSAWAQMDGAGARAPDSAPDTVRQAEQAVSDEEAAPTEQAEPAEQPEQAQQPEQAEQVDRPTMGESSLASKERTLPGGTLALAAYAALWVLVFGLVWISLRRQGKLNAEIAALERRMDAVFEDLD